MAPFGTLRISLVAQLPKNPSQPTIHRCRGAARPTGFDIPLHLGVNGTGQDTALTPPYTANLSRERVCSTGRQLLQIIETGMASAEVRVTAQKMRRLHQNRLFIAGQDLHATEEVLGKRCRLGVRVLLDFNLTKETSMIRTLLNDPATGRQVAGDLDLFEDWRKNETSILWVDFFEIPEKREEELMKEYFALHPLAIQDAQRERHPPKVESFEDHTFVLLKGLDADTQDIQFGTIQIAIFIGERFVVTRHTGKSPSIEKLWSQAEKDMNVLAAGADSLGVRLSGIVVNRYLPILLALEVRLDELEDEMIAHPDDTLLAELVGHKANLKKLRRIVTYHVQLFQTIKTTIPPGIREELRHELTDVYEHLERTMSLAELYYEISSDLMDGYITLASHRLNHIVKVLTIVTTIFVPLSFMAGIYGMNFSYMPELELRYAYFVLLGVMATTACGLLLVLFRKGWIGGH
jgi:magnesium transporter